MAPVQEANNDNLGKSFRISKIRGISVEHEIFSATRYENANNS